MVRIARSYRYALSMTLAKHIDTELVVTVSVERLLLAESCRPILPILAPLSDRFGEKRTFGFFVFLWREARLYVAFARSILGPLLGFLSQIRPTVYSKPRRAGQMDTNKSNGLGYIPLPEFAQVCAKLELKIR